MDPYAEPERCAPGRAAVAAVLALTFVLTSCGSLRGPRLSPPPDDLVRARAERVIVVTVDGLRPDEIGEDHSPNILRMLREGAYTVDARTVDPSLTLPAHASLITGLPPERHGITWNSYRPNRGFLTRTTMFDVARDAGLTTALFAGKEKFRQLIEPDRVDHFSVEPRGDLAVMDDALAWLRSDRPNLMLIHLPGVDRAGHFYGWKSERQRAALEEADEAVGRLEEALVRRDLRSTTVVILTADHGGTGRHHVMHDEGNTTIPWILWGDGIETREIPPVSLMATAAVSLRLLGVELPPDWTRREAARPTPSTATPTAR